NTNETFAWNNPTYGALSTTQLKELLVVPTGNNLILNNANGTLAATSASNTVAGTSTAFTATFAVGDFIYLTPNATASFLGRITAIPSDTSLQLDRALTFSNTTCTYLKVYPKNVPIPLDRIPTANASIDGTGATLTV